MNKEILEYLMSIDEDTYRLGIELALQDDPDGWIKYLNSSMVTVGCVVSFLSEYLKIRSLWTEQY